MAAKRSLVDSSSRNCCENLNPTKKLKKITGSHVDLAYATSKLSVSNQNDKKLRFSSSSFWLLSQLQPMHKRVMQLRSEGSDLDLPLTPYQSMPGFDDVNMPMQRAVMS